ncbi:TIGR00270 family protein [Candidatus Woesearchaeota archaeon]|nr:TIGR00270 family protein [Candidatus Woesearchaeota archaeon]
MPCDMCGAESELLLAEIEGVRMQVCATCARFGKVLGKAPAGPSRVPVRPARPEPPEEPEWTIVADYAQRIRDRRESLGMKQEDLAKKLAEKESLVHKIEVGAFSPGLELARKIEKLLGITLLEKAAPGDAPSGVEKRGALTLGDIARLRKA